MLAICPGSFDPVTHGHLDIITRAATLFDHVIVAVGRNSAKNHLFALEERVEMLSAATVGLPDVRVLPLSGLLVDFCLAHGAGVIVKGLRFASDFDYELQMAHMNAAVGGIETVMVPASAAWATVSSTMIREVASYGGDVSGFVPELVAERIRETVARRQKETSDG